MLARTSPQPIAPHRNGVMAPPDPPPKRDNAMLVQYTGDDDRRCWPLSRIDPVTIDRHDSCVVALPMRKVSRQHARVIWFQDRYVIEDLGSTNGTFVNGDRCHGPLALQDGDEIQIGFCAKLYFLDDETTEPLEFEQNRSGLHVDQGSRSLTVNGARLAKPLSPPQLGLLKVLLDANGEIVSRDEIIDVIWPGENHNGVSEQAVDAIVRRVRIRIRELDEEHSYIETVRGHGFRFMQRPNHNGC